jgi:Mg-chelatase subunit ChlD
MGEITAAAEALARLSPGGGTALYNAIMVALGEQQQRRASRAETYRR